MAKSRRKAPPNREAPNREEDDFFLILVLGAGVLWYISQQSGGESFAPMPAPTGSW